MAVRVPYKFALLTLLGSAAVAGAAWTATGWLDGPWGMLPGGRLTGPASSCAGVRWNEFATIREIEVETRPSRPRSVTTWSVVHAEELVIPADFLTPWKRWPHDVIEDPRVRIRLDGRVFECQAERIENAERIEHLRRAIAAKYGLQADGRAATMEVWWFRVRPR